MTIAVAVGADAVTRTLARACQVSINVRTDRCDPEELPHVD